MKQNIKSVWKNNFCVLVLLQNYTRMGNQTGANDSDHYRTMSHATLAAEQPLLSHNVYCKLCSLQPNDEYCGHPIEGKLYTTYKRSVLGNCSFTNVF